MPGKEFPDGVLAGILATLLETNVRRDNKSLPKGWQYALNPFDKQREYKTIGVCCSCARKTESCVLQNMPKPTHTITFLCAGGRIVLDSEEFASKFDASSVKW